MEPETIEPTKEQLNQAAKISAGRGIDFDAALDLVMTNPEAAQSALNGSRPKSMQKDPQLIALAPAEFATILKDMHTKGGADALQSAKIEELEADRDELQVRIENLEAANSALMVGTLDHFKQHQAFEDGEIETIDTPQSFNLILEQLRKSGVRNPERLLPANVIVKDGQVVDVIAKDVTPQALPK